MPSFRISTLLSTFLELEQYLGPLAEAGSKASKGEEESYLVLKTVNLWKSKY
jgi:hypothetical protein